MGGHWVANEGYLQFKVDGSPVHDAVAHALHRPTLVERYFVLYLNRKVEVFENSTKDPARRIDAFYVRAFCGWDGEGLLKAGESYGLELKLEKNAHSRMFVAAYNRLDVEKWCRGFVAVLDPESAAGQEVRRERRKARKEEKRLQEEKEEKIRQWKEQQKKMIEDEKRRLQLREEEILNMTPLERIDGLGSLDDDTARLLEKRRQRLQRRQAPTTRRVNKAAYRQRMEDAAGGKLENVQPLQAKVVAEQRSKVRIEPPPPGQFIEASGAAAVRRNSNPARRRRLDSTDGSASGSDNSSVSGDSRMSSGPFSSGSLSGSIPPPPPPRSEYDDSRSDFIPPPPPSRRESRAHSVRGSFYGEDDRRSEYASSRASMSLSSRRLSGVDRDKQSVQANLAAILGGRTMVSRGDDRRGRFDSFDSTADSTANGDIAPVSRQKKSIAQAGESSATNAFAASLAAIRRNRADTMDDSVGVDVPPQRKRDRKRDSQLSAEGKAILQKVISMDEPPSTKPKKGTANGRKGLFDESSSDDNDSDAGLFGVRKQTPTAAPTQVSDVSERPSMQGTRQPVQRETVKNDQSDDSDGDDGEGLDFVKRSEPSEYTSPRSSASASRPNFSSQPRRVDVIYKSCVLQNQGKKAIAVYTFSFRVGAAELSFTHSYHEYDDIHQRLSAESLPALPKFPSKHLMRNNTKPENMQKRAMEFVQYFQQLVATPGIFDNKRFLFEYQISDDFVQEVNGAVSMSRSQVSPTPSRTPKPARTNAPKATNGGPSRATALFGADDTDSDAESVSVPFSTPTKPEPAVPLSPEKKKKRSKPSRRAFDAEAVEAPTSGRRDRARSRNSVKSAFGGADATPQSSEPPAPKITGLPARPNLFGGGRGDLLAAIRQGAALKKVDDEEPVAPTLASAGRGAGFPAPSSAPLPPPPPPRPAPLANAGSVAEAITNAMAARRIHVEYEDKSDDSDDDWE